MDRIAQIVFALRQVFGDRALEVAEHQAAVADDTGAAETWLAIVAVLRSPPDEGDPR